MTHDGFEAKSGRGVKWGPRAPSELRFFTPAQQPSDAEKAICFIVYVALALAALMLIGWACLTWGPKL